MQNAGLSSWALELTLETHMLVTVPLIRHVPALVSAVTDHGGVGTVASVTLQPTRVTVELWT